MAREVRQLTTRYGGSLGTPFLEAELVLLARIRHAGIMPTRAVTEQELHVSHSLERFRLLDHGHLYDDGRWVDWALVVNEHGQQVLDARPARWEGCRCEHAIRLNCVCTERTYCPNPDHTGNGCHGTHD